MPPAFEVLGPAERGEKCALCREAKGANRIRIKRGVVTYMLHEDCAPEYFAAHPDDDDGLGPM